VQAVFCLYEILDVRGLKKNLNEVGLRRYIEMNEIEICEFRRQELYGEDEKC
jgi:hypothetical protein